MTTLTAPTGQHQGVLRFARYAYPPNALGYCGPDQADTLLQQAAAGVVDPDLVRLARGFDGAWPYLELIAHRSGIADPLDERVVDAYWLGNELLDRVGPRALEEELRERFRPRLGRHWEVLRDAPLADAVPHHNLHVFVVYPWVGLLRGGQVAEPLRVLDRCRVRWGEVVQVDGSTALVRSRRVVWDGRLLRLAAPDLEHVTVAVRGARLTPEVRPGDRVAMHWGWVCERLEPRQVRELARRTGHAMALANLLLQRPDAPVG